MRIRWRRWAIEARLAAWTDPYTGEILTFNDWLTGRMRYSKRGAHDQAAHDTQRHPTHTSPDHPDALFEYRPIKLSLLMTKEEHQAEEAYRNECKDARRNQDSARRCLGGDEQGQDVRR